MSKNEEKNNMSSKEFNEEVKFNDYKFLVQKLKNIKESIDLLDKNTLKKEK